jgi:hypothetical protein
VPRALQFWPGLNPQDFLILDEIAQELHRPRPRSPTTSISVGWMSAASQSSQAVQTLQLPLQTPLQVQGLDILGSKKILQDYYSLDKVEFRAMGSGTWDELHTEFFFTLFHRKLKDLG